MAKRHVTKPKPRRRLPSSANLPVELLFACEDLTLTAAAEGEVPAFEMVAYSGGELRVAGYPHPVVVDLKGVDINANAPALLDHRDTQRVGHFESLRIEGNRILASGRVSAVNEFAEEVIQSARNGYRWHASIGARVIEAHVIPAGRFVTVNGRSFAGPIIVARRARLNEVSFVGRGGDEDNQVTLAATYSEDESMTFSQWLAANGFDEASLSDAQASVLQASFDSQNTAPEGDPSEPPRATVPAATPDPVAALRNDLRAAAAAERERIAAIDSALSGHADLQAQAIREGWDATQAELAALRRERDVIRAQAAPFGRSSGQRPEDGPRAIEAAIARQLGVSSDTLEASFSEQVLERSSDRRFRNIGLNELMDMTIEAAGFHAGRGDYSDSSRMERFVQAERIARSNLLATGGSFSTISTTDILSNTANKLLLQAFNSVAGVGMSLSQKRSVSDFKTHTSYRLTGDGNFLEVGANGEIKHMSLQDEKYTNSAKTYGTMLTLGRNDIINDDLGAFQSIPTILGRKAAVFFEKAWFTKLLANSGPLFHANNGNLATGAGSVLGIAGLTLVEQKFSDQVDKDGDPILLSPATLLVPTGLRVTAQQLMQETRVNETTTANVAKVASNPHAGKWNVVVSPYLNGQGLTSQSATAYYLFANPNDLALFTVSLLNGRDTPAIETSDMDFNVLGMQFRAVFDFGIDTADVKAAVKSDGA